MDRYLLPAALLALGLGLAVVLSNSPATPASSGLPLPSSPPASADLVSNWGDTPLELRPLFARMEEAAGVPGSARFFAIVAARESGFSVTAHNDDDDEVDASRRAYDNNQATKPALAFAVEARGFGSGGLFGQLAPYFLWTASAELKAAAPLLAMPPAAVFDPRLAAFGAVILLRRLLTHLADARVGWASVDLLGAKRGSEQYFAVRKRFTDSAAKLGIALQLLPSKLQLAPWQGELAAFNLLTKA